MLEMISQQNLTDIYQLDTTMLEMISFQNLTDILAGQQNVGDDLITSLKQKLKVSVVTQLPQAVWLQQGLWTGQHQPNVFTYTVSAQQPTNQSTSQLVKLIIQSANQ